MNINFTQNSQNPQKASRCALAAIRMEALGGTPTSAGEATRILCFPWISV